jgi:uncharacterized Zn-finger protein
MNYASIRRCLTAIEKELGIKACPYCKGVTKIAPRVSKDDPGARCSYCGRPTRVVRGRLEVR